MKEILKKHKQYLLSGVSFAIPFIATGGILLAIAFAFAPMTATGPDLTGHPYLQMLEKIGGTSFALMLPVLAGYISYAIAGKPGLAAGFIGGFLSGEVKAGFIGALIIGLVAGHLVNLIKKVPVPKFVKPVMPILIIPIFSSVVVGVLMLKVVGVPIASLMDNLGLWLADMGQGNQVILALILGAMIAFDMGGPVNKAAFFFGAGLIKEGNIYIMGPVAAAICIPPIGLGLATLIYRKLWTEQEKDAGYAALGMGMMGITEGAIPFAAADPFRVIPCIMAGSMTGAVIAMLCRVGDNAPHGGPIVTMVVENKAAYIISIIAGSIVTAASIIFVKILTSAKQGEAR